MTTAPEIATPPDSAQNADLLRQLGSAVMNDPRIKAAEWEQLVLLIRNEGTQWRIAGFGFNQNDDSKPDAFPIAPTGLDVSVAASALRDFMHPTGGSSEKWLVSVVYIHRRTGDFKVTFSSEDEPRYKITTDNLDELSITWRPPAQGYSAA